jgi:hypothetical protein
MSISIWLPSLDMGSNELTIIPASGRPRMVYRMLFCKLNFLCITHRSFKSEIDTPAFYKETCQFLRTKSPQIVKKISRNGNSKKINKSQPKFQLRFYVDPAQISANPPSAENVTD